VYKIVVEPSAAKDIAMACDYYATLPIDTDKIMNRFLEDIEETFKTLSINPNYQIRVKKFRAFQLKNFPYLVFFTVHKKEKTVKVIALFNTYKEPKKYPK